MHERARVRGSDTMLDRALPNVWTLRDGKLARTEFFRDRREALEAAGLSG